VRLVAGVSSSSILLSALSGLLARVATEAFVFLLSLGVGSDGSGFLLEVVLDSHEKGLVSFLDGAGVGVGSDFRCSTAGGGGGGGGKLTGDILPDSP
jgi:hypothetical protein